MPSKRRLKVSNRNPNLPAYPTSPYPTSPYPTSPTNLLPSPPHPSLPLLILYHSRHWCQLPRVVIGGSITIPTESRLVEEPIRGTTDTLGRGAYQTQGTRYVITRCHGCHSILPSYISLPIFPPVTLITSLVIRYDEICYYRMRWMP